MKMKYVLLVLILFGAAFAGISIDEYSLTKDIYKPGEPGVATVTVSNPTGSERVTSITMTLSSSPELILSGSPKLADIDAGGSAIVSLPFKVKSDAKPGIYTIKAFFSGYKSQEAAGTSQISVNSISIPVTVVNEPELSYYVDTKVLEGLDEIELTITNNGGAAKNLKLSTPGDVSLYGADKVYVGDLLDTETVKLLLDSRDVEEGTSNILITVSYQDELGFSHTEDVSIRMTIRDEKLDVRFIQQDGLSTRMEDTLILEVRNDGEEELEDVRLVFTDAMLKLKDVSELKFGDIKPGGSATASALVYTELSPGVNLLPAKVEWIEKDVQQEEERDVAVTVTSDADVSVFLEAKPLPLSAGGEHTISVLVSNLGTFSIENVDVAISSPALRSVDISDRQYIGGLQRDDFSTVQFLMQVNATGPGEYPVYLDINYRDLSGEWKNKKITQTITVHDGMQTEDSSPVTLILVVVVLAVVVWYFKFRKK